MLGKCGNAARGEADTVSGREEDLPAFTIQISNLRIVLDPQLQNSDST